MGAHSRPKPEERLDVILEAAAKSIEQSTLLDFTMASIAREAGVSIGTLYKHVQTKEDVLVALATETAINYRSVYTRIRALDISPAEFFVAPLLKDPGLVQRFPFDSQLETLVASDAIRSRSSAMWRDRLDTLTHALTEDFHGRLAEAAETGELDCAADSGNCLERANHGLWAFTVGTFQVSRIKRSTDAGAADAADALTFEPDGPELQNMKAYINTFPWREPLTDEGIRRVCALLVEIGYR